MVKRAKAKASPRSRGNKEDGPLNKFMHSRMRSKGPPSLGRS